MRQTTEQTMNAEQLMGDTSCHKEIKQTERL